MAIFAQERCDDYRFSGKERKDFGLTNFYTHNRHWRPLHARADDAARSLLRTAKTSPSRRHRHMNAPLPESIRKALETVTLDDNPRSGLRRSHNCSLAGAAGQAVFGVEPACHTEI
jgi:hypothetical protein